MENPDTAREPIVIPLSADEALILFELISRFEQDAILQISNPAESHALSRLLAQLEKQLVAPFDMAYSAILSAARARLRTRYGDDEGPRRQRSSPL